MYLISKITSDTSQTQQIIIPNGDPVQLTIYFRPMQYGWFITELTWKNFTLNGLRICNSPNLLYQWKNVLPFGLACFSTDNREPTQQQDFLSKASQLYILSPEEVVEYTEFLTSV